jgi:hypothetical protein
VRLTEDEALALRSKAAAAGMTVSEFFRDHAGKVTVRNRKDLRDLRLEVAAVGRLLNQIARWAHTHKNRYETLWVIEELQVVKEAVTTLIESSTRLSKSGDEG